MESLRIGRFRNLLNDTFFTHMLADINFTLFLIFMFNWTDNRWGLLAMN